MENLFCDGSLVSRVFAQPPSCGARHERGRANNPQKARGFGHVAQHGVHHHIMGMRPHVSHTTSAAAACRSAHAGRVLADCSALPDLGPRGAVASDPSGPAAA